MESVDAVSSGSWSSEEPTGSVASFPLAIMIDSVSSWDLGCFDGVCASFCDGSGDRDRLADGGTVRGGALARDASPGDRFSCGLSTVMVEQDPEAVSSLVDGVPESGVVGSALV